MRTVSFLSILGSLLLSGMTVPAVEIIGHRGASYDAPENTLSSMKLGWEQKADANELDIYLSKDRQVVLLHDATTKRTAGKDKPIVEQTLEEIRTLDAGSWKDPKWAGEKIPTLTEVLQLLSDNRRLFIEIKTGPEILPALKQVLDASERKPEQLTIISFNYEVVRDAKKLFPKQEVYWLASPGVDKKTGKAPTIEELIQKAKEAGLDGLNLNFKFPIDAAFVSQVHAAGLKLYTWTVDDLAVAKKLVAAGVEGITTNRPAWLREQLAKAE